jgi:hypothetical protein
VSKDAAAYAVCHAGPANIVLVLWLGLQRCYILFAVALNEPSTQHCSLRIAALLLTLSAWMTAEVAAVLTDGCS